MLACNPVPQQAHAESDKEESGQNFLWGQVMAIHNEVMPEMTRIFRLQKKLKILIDSLQSEGTIATFSVDSLQKLNDDLQKADKAMMNCKRFSEFQVEGKQHEEIIEALVSEKESVIVVREKMLDSIQKAEDILQYIETP